MNIPDLIDGFITWQSTLPCRANQETPFMDERVFQNRGFCGQAFPFLPSPPPSRAFLRSPQFSRVQKAKNASNLRKALRKRFLRRLGLCMLETLIGKKVFVVGNTLLF